MMIEASPATTEYAGPREKGRRTRWDLRAAALLLVGSLGLNLYLVWTVRQLRSSVQSLRLKNELQIGTDVPPIKAKAVDGREMTINFSPHGRPTVLYFFSPTCGWCEENINNIKELAKARREAYEFLGLSLTNDALTEYALRHELGFPVVNGLSIETMKAYRLGRTPQTIVVSPEGRVLANWVGVYEGDLRSRIEDFFHLQPN